MENKKIIDMKLGTELAGGNEALAKELLKLLVDELPTFQQDLTGAFQKENYETLAKVAHKLHGGTCYTGTPMLKTASKNLEVAAKESEKNSVEIAKLYRLLAEEIQSVIANYSSFK